MIATPVWNPAIWAARVQPMNARTNCARIGMAQILNNYFQDSINCLANRRADGLAPIDQAAHALTAAWPGAGPLSALIDARVTAVLNACSSWLTNRRFLGFRVTGWREAAIAALYWQTAWCYSCDNYARRAILAIGVNNGLNVATTATEPVPVAQLIGNPYQFAGSGYAHQNVPGLLRGDSRGPDTIANVSNGFQPRTVIYGAYQPWFDGHNTATPSTTNDQQLAINAAKAAAGPGGSPAGILPAWLNGVLTGLAPLGANRRGFVYELGNLGALNSTRLLAAPLGREHIFLAIPPAAITRWWVVLSNSHTVGPFPFPAAALAPAMGVAYSGNPNVLA